MFRKPPDARRTANKFMRPVKNPVTVYFLLAISLRPRITNAAMKEGKNVACSTASLWVIKIIKVYGIRDATLMREIDLLHPISRWKKYLDVGENTVAWNQGRIYKTARLLLKTIWGIILEMIGFVCVDL